MDRGSVANRGELNLRDLDRLGWVGRPGFGLTRTSCGQGAGTPLAGLRRRCWATCPIERSKLPRGFSHTLRAPQSACRDTDPARFACHSRAAVVRGLARLYSF